MCRLSWNLGASTSWNPQGLPRPVMGLLYLYLTFPVRIHEHKVAICWWQDELLVRCNHLCHLLCSAMVTNDTLIGVSWILSQGIYRGLNSTVWRVVLYNKLYFSLLGLQYLPIRHNSTAGVPAKCTPFYLLSLFLAQVSNAKPATQQPELTPALTNILYLFPT